MSGNLSVTLSLDTSGFSSGVRTAIGGVDKLKINVEGLDRALVRNARRVERTSRSYRHFGHTIRDVVATIGLSRAAMLSVIDVTWTWQRAIIAQNMELERSAKLLENFAEGVTAPERMENAAKDVE